jgi:uncharacterized protein (PEP-CTERM system associated)
LVSAPAQAGDWMIRPRLSVSETWTDNVGLDRTAGDSDFITQLNPGLSLQGRGGRVSAYLDYSAQGLLFLDDGSRSSINHQLQSDFTAELIEDKLTIGANASIFQAVIDPTQRFASRNIHLAQNRADISSYGASIGFRQRLGAIGAINLNYTYNDIVNGDGNTVDGSYDAFTWTLDLNEGAENRRFRWDVSYDRRNTGNRRSSGDTFQKALLNVSYAISKKIRVNASSGYEFNSFRSNRRREDDGFVWNAGATFVPSRLTSITAAFGERAFGDTFQVNATHRRRRLVFSLRYDEEFTTTSAVLSQLQLIPLVDEFGRPVFDPITNAVILVPIDTPTLVDDAYVRKRASATVGYIRPRSYLSFGLHREIRDYEISLLKERTFGATASFTHAFSSQLSGGVSLSWRDFERPTAGFSSTYINVSPHLSYRWGPNMSTQFRYDYSRGDGEATFDYSENTVTASMVYLF